MIIMKKIILVVIDGLGDEPIPQLGNKTPLKAAKKPNLDFLAKEGICGKVIPWTKKEELPTSEETHLALFGYDPEKENPGRGVLEALGINFKILPSDVCLRGNFATLDPKTNKILDRRAGRIEKTKGLIKAISGIEIKGIKFFVGKGLSHRIVILMRGKGLSQKISGNDTKKIGVSPQKILAKDKTKSAKFTAMVLEEFLEKSYQILKAHPLNKKRKLPANYLLVRGAGQMKKVKSFKRKYNLKAGFVAGAPLYKGIARFLGMEEIKVRGATGLANTNLKGKVLAAKRNLKKYNFIFLHIKAADNFAEDGNFLAKKQFLERFDKECKPLIELKKVLIAITGDHSTSSLKKGHCNLANPILVWGNGKDRVEIFSEEDCESGGLGKIPQLKLMPKLLKLAKN